MGHMFGGGSSQVTQASPNQVITPDRNQVLSEGQRTVDNNLGDFITANMNSMNQSYGHTPMQLYPLNNYQQTQMPTFNPIDYYRMYGQGYGAQNLNQQQPFGLQSAGRPYQLQPQNQQGRA